MMMPSIFGENLFDDWMDFLFEEEFLWKKKSSYMVTTCKEYDENRCA